MTLTKKEKTMIFILIIVMLVGGFYVYGIQPQQTKMEEMEAEITSLGDQKTEIEDNAIAYNSNALRNKFEEIKANAALLELLSAPGVDTNKEIESGNLPDNSTNDKVAYGMIAYLAMHGIQASPSISMPEPNRSDGKIIYNYSTGYSCSSMVEIMNFVDDVARHTAFYITRITIAEDNTGGVTTYTGTLAMTITYLDV